MCGCGIEAISGAEGDGIMNKDDEQVIELADDLTMLATQIREAGRGEGALPNPWHVDDWLARYRWLYQAERGSRESWTTGMAPYKWEEE